MQYGTRSHRGGRSFRDGMSLEEARRIYKEEGGFWDKNVLVSLGRGEHLGAILIVQQVGTVVRVGEVNTPCLNKQRGMKLLESILKGFSEPCAITQDSSDRSTV